MQMEGKKDNILIYLCFMGIFLICGTIAGVINLDLNLLADNKGNKFNFYNIFFVLSLITLIIYIFAQYYKNKFIGLINNKVVGLILIYIGINIAYFSITKNYHFSLITALIFISCGIILIKVFINSFITMSDNKSKINSSLNLVLGFYSIGFFVSLFLLPKYIKSINQSSNNNIITIIYFLFSIIIIYCIIIFIKKLSSKKNHSQTNINIFNEPNFLLGMIAIFFYYGAETSIGNNIGNLLKLPNTIEAKEDTIQKYIYFYWGGIMSGRFLGCIYLSNINNYLKYLFISIIYIAFVSLMMFLTKFQLNQIIFFILILMLNLFCFVISKYSYTKILYIFSLASIFLLIVAISNNFQIVGWAIVGLGIFNSVIWANILCIATDKLGNNIVKAVAFLIFISLIGSFVINNIQDFFANQIGPQKSFIIPILCYIYTFLYGIKGNIDLKK